jgi:hypothetical protein
MLADRVGTQYDNGGNSYTIGPWRWGPLHPYCNTYLLGCVDWEHDTAPGTHPTVDKLDWTIPSCKGDGCGTTYCYGGLLISAEYPIPVFFSQTWPWD